MPKKTVIRSCCACRKHGEKKEFIRIVRKPDGGIVIDRNAKISGRGIYVCPDLKCIEKACRSHAIEKGFRRSEIPAEIYERLKTECRGKIQIV